MTSGPNCFGDSRKCLWASRPLPPPFPVCGDRSGLVWHLNALDLLLCNKYDSCAVWVTQSLAWGTSARPAELPTCLDPCLNRDSMTQRQGRVVLSVWLMSSTPGSFSLVVWQLRGKPHYPRQQCPSEGRPHRKGQPASTTQLPGVRRKHKGTVSI